MLDADLFLLQHTNKYNTHHFKKVDPFLIGKTTLPKDPIQSNQSPVALDY
jgi:hypothetical protein